MMAPIRHVLAQVPELVAALGLLIGSIVGTMLGDIALGAIGGAILGLGAAVTVTNSPEDGS
jgi:hypothetical protein